MRTGLTFWGNEFSIKANLCALHFLILGVAMLEYLQKFLSIILKKSSHSKQSAQSVRAKANNSVIVSGNSRVSGNAFIGNKRMNDSAYP